MKKTKKKLPTLLRTFLFILVFATVTAAVIVYARGYRIDPEKRILASHGILSVSASPKASKVYINGEFKGVTDMNITLPAGQYKIEVKKDGYTTWTRTIKLKGELVVTLDVLLYPLNPSLTPLTNVGVAKAVPIARTGKVIIFSQANDPEKDGIYLFEPSSSPISFFTPLKLLVLKKDLPVNTDFSKSDLVFSPDYKQAVITLDKTQPGSTSYLISISEANAQLFDVTTSKDALYSAWDEERTKEMDKIIEAFPKDLRKVASASMQVIEISPDNTKILYQAKTSAELPPVITPPLISTNQTQETRVITPLYIYVYDKKEDRNYLLTSNADWIRRFQDGIPVLNPKEEQSFIYWHPDSKHLLLNEGPQIVAMGYDGQDKQTVYSGPFDKAFFDVANEGNPVVMTNLNPQFNQYPDLYVVGIK